jgi:predicted transcriptional regulator
VAKISAKTHTTTLRLDDGTFGRLQRMVAENPLYSPSHVMRGALLALSRLTDSEREACILAVAKGGVDEL